MMSAVRSRIERFMEVSGDRRRLLLLSWLLQSSTACGLRVLGYARVRAMLDARLAHPTRTDPGASTLADIVWAATVSGRYAPGATCLTRALVARRLLLRRGIPASVEIGVHLDSNGQVRGHAWVVSHGAIVLGGEESARQYIALGL